MNSEHVYDGRELLKDSALLADAEGIYLRDTLGREYIDCGSGTFDQPLGYKHPALVSALKRQAETLPYAPSALVSKDVLELTKKLIEIAPPNLTRVHLRDVTGSTAIEGAIKIAQAATGKRDVISLFGSHHGQTFMGTDVSGNSFRREQLTQHFAGTVHVPAANCHRCFYKQSYPSCGLLCVDRIRDFIEYATSGSVAAMVVEPIQGNGGNVMPPRDYFRKLKALCEEYGIVLIFDEVQTGMGRTGYMFAAEYFGVEPHMMVLGKGLGGPAPRAAILLEERLEKLPRYQHAFTGSASQLSTATALATIEVLRQPGFLEGVRARGEILGAGLKALRERYPFISDARGLGFMWGIEISRPDGSPDVELTNRIAARAREHGLILRTSRYGYGNVVKVRPPLITSESEIREILKRIEHTLESLK